MRTSQNGIDLIKKYEGCKLQAYKCPAGVWTIGYGHTAGVKQGDLITQAQADEFLKNDLKVYEQKVSKFSSKYIWGQNEFDALVSFCYNIGSINQLTAKGTRTKDVIAEKMLEYNKAGGKVLSGLTKRRQDEHDLFLKKVEGVKMGVQTYSLKTDGEKSLSQNFKIKEFRCKDGSDKIFIDSAFVQMKLQQIRDYFNSPVTINSAYRTSAYNVKIGGAKNSYHVKGQAFDIVVKGKTPTQVAKYAQQLGINGIIQYNTFVHLDSRSKKYWARNNNGKVTVVNNF